MPSTSSKYESTSDDAIYFGDDEIKTASNWHGGQSSMLYAVASTGMLSRGTHRPRGIDTDAEWMVDLASRLESEALDAAKEAGKQARKAKGSEKKDLLNDQSNLESIAVQAAMAASSKGRAHHATKKSPAQLDREIAEALKPSARSHATIAKLDPSQLRVGQLFDYFGQIYEVTKIARDKLRTVSIARRVRDLFSKEGLIDQRAFPARDFDRQHLRPIDRQDAERKGWPPLVR